MLKGLNVLTANWRSGGIVALTAIAAIVAVSAGGLSGSSTVNPTDITLLYIGADDCAPCRAWQGGDGAMFRISSEFDRLTYREVKSPTVLDVLKDENWPEGLRGYRGRLGRGAGVPMWLVIVKDDIVGQGFGARQWQDAVLPKIRSLVR